MASLTFSLLDTPAARPALAVLFSALVLGSISDLRSRRLPNVLTFSAAALGIAIHGLWGGAPELVNSLLSFLAAFVLGLGLYSMWGGQGFGAGDAKMVMAAAALIGFWPAIWMFFLSNLIMAFAYLPLRWLVQGTFLANVRSMLVWLLSILVAFASKIGLAGKGAHIIHFVPVGMEDKTPHAPFMLLGALGVVLLAQKGALPW